MNSVYDLYVALYICIYVFTAVTRHNHNCMYINNNHRMNIYCNVTYFNKNMSLYLAAYCKSCSDKHVGILYVLYSRILNEQQKSRTFIQNHIYQ